MVMPSTRTRLLASTIMIGAVFGAGASAQAQDASTGQSGTTVKEVVVTGSRIPRPNTTAVSPVQTVGQQELKLEGTVDAELMLNNLPSVSPSASQFSNNGATGIATVNLRGFGANRTLVLIDGQRMPPGDPRQPVADLNLIPSALIDRVDVMTGGASSIYGSDAIAGVVNFIMKHNFEGVQMDAQYDFAQHDNNSSSADAVAKAAGFTAPSGNTIQGRTEHITITFGANSPDGKGNLEGYLGYIHQDPVRQSAYDYAYCALGEQRPHDRRQILRHQPLLRRLVQLGLRQVHRQLLGQPEFQRSVHPGRDPVVQFEFAVEQPRRSGQLRELRRGPSRRCLSDLELRAGPSTSCAMTPAIRAATSRTMTSTITSRPTRTSCSRTTTRKASWPPAACSPTTARSTRSAVTTHWPRRRNWRRSAAQPVQLSLTGQAVAVECVRRQPGLRRSRLEHLSQPLRDRLPHADEPRDYLLDPRLVQDGRGLQGQHRRHLEL